MGDFFLEEDDRVTGRAVVTGKATYASEHDIAGVTYGVLAGSTIANGNIIAIDTKAAERADGVISVITHLNALKVPGYESEDGARLGFKVFNSSKIYFGGQPIALVIADTFERATYASSLIKCQYDKAEPDTNFTTAGNGKKPVEGPRYKDTLRGSATAFAACPVKIEAEYTLPIEVHNPMELHGIIAKWEGEDKVTVWDKTQGVKSTQGSIVRAFKLKEENVQVYAPYVGGGFGSALRTWPHEIAALIGAKQTGRPVKLVLTRNQMFTLVGFRPYTNQKIKLGASEDGKLQFISHEADAVTSMYEEFNERSVDISKTLYACNNVVTRYHVYQYNISTPTWMRGPGEATGAFALETALDELSYKLKIDPLELRLINHADTDPETGKQFSSKFLKEAYKLGADAIGWKMRTPDTGKMENGMLVGYGMAGGTFGASRGKAKAMARLYADGTLIVQSAVSDSGPGTSTSMAIIASESMGIPMANVSFELGDSSLPPGPTQGGSTTTSTLGSAVSIVCDSLKKKLLVLAGTDFTQSAEPDIADYNFSDGAISTKSAGSKKLTYREILEDNKLNQVEVTEESTPNPKMKDYVAASYSVHFVKVLVNPASGVVKVDKIVIAGDAGKIVNMKTAESQMIGGAVGGLGMALTEEGILDERYGRWINNNFADYHVPVHADIPEIKALFVNKHDPYLNPIGAKGMGEIALIGFAAAVGNAVYNATGKRVRDLPITGDKVL